MDKIKVILLLTELRDYYIKHEDIWDKTTPIEDRIHIYCGLNCNVNKIQSVIDTLKEEVRKDNAKASGKSNLYKGVMDLMAVSKGTPREDNLYGVFGVGNKECVMCDCMLCAFDKGILPKDLPICKIPTYTNAICEYLNPVKNTANIKVNIPNLKSLKAEKKLNNEIFPKKYINGKLVVIKVRDDYYKGFNIDYLIIMREIFGDDNDVEFYVTNNPAQAMYIKSNVGEGFCLPINLKDKDFTKFIIPRI